MLEFKKGDRLNNTTKTPVSDMLEKTEMPIYAVTLATLITEGRRKTLFIMALLALLGISMGGNIIQFNYLPQSVILSETEDGRIRPLPTIDNPIFTNAHVINWTASKLEAIYDLPFTKISVYPSKLHQFMMPNAVEQFIDGLQKAGIIDKIIDERSVMRGVRKGPPAVTQTMMKDGRFVWTLEMPISVIFEGAGGQGAQEKQELVIRVFVGREHLLKAKDGLIIGAIEVYAGSKLK